MRTIKILRNRQNVLGKEGQEEANPSITVKREPEQEMESDSETLDDSLYYCRCSNVTVCITATVAMEEAATKKPLNKPSEFGTNLRPNDQTTKLLQTFQTQLFSQTLTYPDIP